MSEQIRASPSALQPRTVSGHLFRNALTRTGFRLPRCRSIKCKTSESWRKAHQEGEMKRSIQASLEGEFSSQKKRSMKGKGGKHLHRPTCCTFHPDIDIFIQIIYLANSNYSHLFLSSFCAPGKGIIWYMHWCSLAVCTLPLINASR